MATERSAALWVIAVVLSVIAVVLIFFGVFFFTGYVVSEEDGYDQNGKGNSGDDDFWDLPRYVCDELQRDVEFCTAVYDPVCGWRSSPDLERTNSNNCYACRDPRVI
jgi:hypothetical protein